MIATLPLEGYATDIAIRDDLAYVTSGGIHVVSISDPLQPVLVGRYVTEQTSKSLLLDGDRLYFGDGSVLRILSIADPTQPVELGSYVLGLQPHLDLLGPYLAVGLEWRGLRVFDVSDPQDVWGITGLDTADRAAGIDVEDDRIYIADEHGGLLIFRLVE